MSSRAQWGWWGLAGLGLLLVAWVATGPLVFPAGNAPPLQIPADLYLLLPPLGLVAIGGLNGLAARRGQATLAAWVGLLLTIFLLLQFRFGLQHQRETDPRFLAEAPLRPLLTGQLSPGDTLFVAAPAEAQNAVIRHLSAENRGVAIRAGEEVETTTGGGDWWLYERHYAPGDSLSAAGRWLGENAFFIGETWLDGGGRLTHYAPPTALPVAVEQNEAFAGGVTLRRFALPTDRFSPGAVVPVQLRWQAPANLPPEPVVAFAQLIAENDGGLVAQQDRLLLSAGAPGQSPLAAGETKSQGYGLLLPENLAAGRYALVIGLYNGQTTARLFRANHPDDFLYLTTITVQ